MQKNPFEKVRYSNFGSREEAVTRLMKDLKKLKVHLPENFDENELLKGFGEPVCFIVNDLTNRELIRRKFSFKMPDFENLYN